MGRFGGIVAISIDVRAGVDVTPAGSTFRDGWKLYDVGEDGSTAVLGRRVDGQPELRTHAVSELVDARAMMSLRDLPAGDVRLTLQPVAPDSRAAARRADIDGARVLVFDGARPEGHQFIGTERTITPEFRGPVDATLATIDHARTRYGRAGIDGVNGSVSILVNAPSQAGLHAEWNPRSGMLELPAGVAGATPSWRSPSIMSHELEGHAALLADAPFAHRLGGARAGEAAAVHEGWSDVMGMLRTRSPRHGAGPLREPHRLLDQSLAHTPQGWAPMPRSVSGLRALAAADDLPTPHVAGGIVSRAAWDMSQGIGWRATEDVLRGAQTLLREPGAALDFAGTGAVLDEAARAVVAPRDHAAVQRVLLAAGLLTH